MGVGWVGTPPEAMKGRKEETSKQKVSYHSLEKKI